MLAAATDISGAVVIQLDADDSITLQGVAKADLKEWIGNRADAGRLPPRGFPKNNRFG